MSAVAMQNFGFGDQLVRVIDQNGTAWFVANDVCAALEIANSRHAVSRLDEDEKGVVSSDTPGGTQQLTIISESGVYALIFTSRKAAARHFRKWVTSEVLPSIRRTGGYSIDDDDLLNPVPLQNVAPEGMSFTDRLKLEPPNVQLAYVREQRIAKGRPAAIMAMRRLGWEDAEADTPEQLLAAGNPVLCQVTDWMRERTEAAPGQRIGTMALYHDFMRWCAGLRHEPLSLTAFGRALGTLGYASQRSNVTYRVGLKLK